MQVPPPNSYEEFINIAKQVDTNYDGKIRKKELLTVLNEMGYWSIIQPHLIILRININKIIQYI